ncbi:MAG TPA: tetratricopeptide repeat protein, partial [Dongiaceae bacterium]|nr:tetratricopeptide repeat protein [Dongiaceae bacterium]
MKGTKPRRSRARPPATPPSPAARAIEAAAASAAATAATLQQGLALHLGGDLAGAAAVYEAILSRHPDQPDALHLLGVVRHQSGDSEAAVPLIRRAIQLAPGNPHCLINLGAALQALDRPDEAAESYRAALARLPNSAEAHGNLGTIYENRGDAAAALAEYQAAARLNPAKFEYRRHVADLLLDLGRLDEAVDAFRRLLDEAPQHTAVRNNLGLALERRGDFEAAAAEYRMVAEQSPELAEPAGNLGNVLAALGRPEGAEAAYRRAIALAPKDWRHRANLGSFLAQIGRLDEARALFQGIMRELGDDDAPAWNELGAHMAKARCYDDAEIAFRRAVEIDPELLDAYNSLGTLYVLTLRPALGIEAYKSAVRIDPQYLPSQINLCLLLQREMRLDEAAVYAHGLRVLERYDPKYCNSRLVQIMSDVCDFDGLEEVEDIWTTAESFDRGELASILLTLLKLSDTPDKTRRLIGITRRIAAIDEAEAARVALPPLPARAPGKKLRIGLMSADFRRHSAVKFILPVLRHYDRSRFEFSCYSAYPEGPTAGIHQEVTELADAFVSVDGLTDRALASRVRDDRIDVLMDLNGFTARTRIGAFAHRMAPVQVSWLGWPATTGYRAMDYFIVDRFDRPTADDFLLEKPLELPGATFCFESFPEEPMVPPPCLANGYVTLGTFNNPYKFSRATIAAWARVLNRLEGSRFVVVRPECKSLILINHLIQEFGRHGVGADRLDFIDNYRTNVSHFAFYNLMDITLDTFPVTGGTTTCDTLWMGVPTVSLVGDAFHQRLSHSILNHVGLGDLSRASVDDYVETAVALAQDGDRLVRLRNELRPMLLASPLCRADRFVAELQDA